MKNPFKLIEKIIEGPDGPTVVFRLSENSDDLEVLEENENSDMNKTFILKPLEGLEWDGNLIPLGCTKKDIKSIFGDPEVSQGSFYYFDNELRFDFNKKGKLEFIEFLGGIDGRLKPMIYDIPAFESDASEVEELLRVKNAGDVDDAEGEYSSSFLNISVGVYRDITPSDVQEMIEEMKADKIPTEGNEDLENDKRRANHWATIGIGVEGYYRK